MAKNKNKSGFGLKELTAAIAGFAVIGGCAAAWHFWHMDGFWAVFIALFLGGGLLSVAFKEEIWF